VKRKKNHTTNAVESNTYIVLLPYLFDHRPFNILALTSTYSLRKKKILFLCSDFVIY